MIDASSQRTAADSLNEFYWHGTATTSGHAARVRTLVEREIITAGTAGFPLQLLHESGGPALVASMLALLELGKGARAWAWMQRLGDADEMRPRPLRDGVRSCGAFRVHRTRLRRYVPLISTPL